MFLWFDNMKVFKNKGELTRFQILGEIARSQPHLRQKDIAEKLGITIQAVSENIKTLVEEGYMEIGDGRSNYTISKEGVERIKREAKILKSYSEDIIDIMNSYKTVWPAIAAENLEEGETVGIYMDNGILYASHKKASAYGVVLVSVDKGEDVALEGLSGIIDIKRGVVTIVVLPTIKDGGSRATDLDRIKEIYDTGFDRVGVMGTVAHAAANKLNIPIDFEFGLPETSIVASQKGLNTLVLTVGKMRNNLISKLEEKEVQYTLEDVRVY